MKKEEFAEKLAELFPEKAEALVTHYEEYGKLLGHIFFADEINVPLVKLLLSNLETEQIKNYCDFIMEMWKQGSDEVVNIIDVTILERLSDDSQVWSNFAQYISNEFRIYINEVVLRENGMMFHVPEL